MQAQTIDWQAVFFDFDGVIAHSGQVKSKAFAHLFAPYGARVQADVVAYHLANGGIPRNEKLRYCLEQIAGQEYTKKHLTQMEQQFSELVLEEVIAAPLVAGVIDTLQQLLAARVPAYIVSGTPQEEMQVVVRRKHLDNFFAEVHGSPRSKTTIIQDILQRCGYHPAQCLFIGDAMADYRAARATGLAFLGIGADGAASIFPDEVPVSVEVRLSRWTG